MSERMPGERRRRGRERQPQSVPEQSVAVPTGAEDITSSQEGMIQDHTPQEVAHIQELRATFENQVTHETVPTTVSTEEVVRDLNRSGPIAQLRPPDNSQESSHKSAVHGDAHGEVRTPLNIPALAAVLAWAGIKGAWKAGKEITKGSIEGANYVFGPTFKNVFGDFKKAAQKAFGSIFKSSGSKKEAHAGHH